MLAICLKDFWRPVRRSVVHDDDLQVGPGLCQCGVKSLGNVVLSVVGRHTNGHKWTAHVGKTLMLERRLQLAGNSRRCIGHRGISHDYSVHIDIPIGPFIRCLRTYFGLVYGQSDIYPFLFPALPSSLICTLERYRLASSLQISGTECPSIHFGWA